MLMVLFHADTPEPWVSDLVWPFPNQMPKGIHEKSRNRRLHRIQTRISTKQPRDTLFFGSCFSDGRALRLVRVDMPGGVILGEAVALNCSFDLESDQLYSVKWYKGNREFFR